MFSVQRSTNIFECSANPVFSVQRSTNIFEWIRALYLSVHLARLSVSSPTRWKTHSWVLARKIFEHFLFSLVGLAVPKGLLRQGVLITFTLTKDTKFSILKTFFRQYLEDWLVSINQQNDNFSKTEKKTKYSYHSKH